MICGIQGKNDFLAIQNKKHRRCGIKLYKLCGGNGCLYNMAVYLRKQLLSVA
jgi:hypothetical protein